MHNFGRAKRWWTFKRLKKTLRRLFWCLRSSERFRDGVATGGFRCRCFFFFFVGVANSEGHEKVGITAIQWGLIYMNGLMMLDENFQSKIIIIIIINIIIIIIIIELLPCFSRPCLCLWTLVREGLSLFHGPGSAFDHNQRSVSGGPHMSITPWKLAWQWKIIIFNRRHIFIHGCFSSVIRSFQGCNI